MITRMQTVMQKHYKWLFSILLVVIIVSFVFVIGNTGQVPGGSSSAQNVTNFYGYNLAYKSRDVERLSRWTFISSRINRTPFNDNEVQKRMVAVYLADALNIPEPTAEQLQTYNYDRPAFVDPATGKFSLEQFTQILDKLKADRTKAESEEEVFLVMAQDFRIEKVNSVLKGPGYALPFQAEETLRRRETVWSIETADYARKDFSPELNYEDAVLQTYFENNIDAYRVSEQVSINFVKFDSSLYRASEVKEPSEAELLELFNRNPTKYARRDDLNEPGVPAPMAPVAYSEARMDVMADWKAEQTQQLRQLGHEAAGAAAEQFSVDLWEAVYNKTISKEAAAIEQFIAERGLSLQRLDPYDAKNIGVIAAESGISRDNLMEGLALDDNRFLSGAMELSNNAGAVVLIFVERSPARLPELAEVRDQVVKDFEKAETDRQFVEHCNELREKLIAAVAAGDPCKDAAESLGLTYANFTDFKSAPPPKGLAREVISALPGLEVNEFSKAVITTDSGTIARVIKKELPDLEEKADEISSTLDSMVNTFGYFNLQLIYGELIARGQDLGENPES